MSKRGKAAKRERIELRYLVEERTVWFPDDAGRWMQEKFPSFQDVLLHGFRAEDAATREAYAHLADDVFQLVDAASELLRDGGNFVLVDAFDVGGDEGAQELTLILAHGAARHGDWPSGIGQAYAVLAKRMRAYLAASRLAEVA